MKRIAYFVILIVLTLPSSAATVDTVSIYSKAMKKEFKCVVIKPAAYSKQGNPLPVVYLLHGYGGWYSNWIIRVPQLKEHADEYDLIIVCPDGGQSSWYIDSPIDTSMRYETYVGKEVPEFIDANYNSKKSRTGRAITGLSMGGHGGLFLGFRLADRFGACGSMSGAVDLNMSRSSYEIAKRIGDTLNYANNWKRYSVINLIETYPKDSLTIIIDCGTSDFFYQINHQLHQKMLQLKIPHDYIERPGKHDWPYWRNAIKYQLLFFKEYFKRE